MDGYIFYCPSCKVEEKNLRITHQELKDLGTSMLIGDKIIQYMICPHCRYIMAGVRSRFYDNDRDLEIEMRYLKMYTEIGDNSYINHEYEDLLKNAKRKIDDGIKYHKRILEILENPLDELK